MSAVAGRTVEVEHRVPGSPQDAFAYFTDPAKHVLWQGVRADLDARPGGVYIVHLNDRTRVRGEYLVVEPPRRIVLAWGWESEDEFPQGTQELPPGSTTVEISFIEDGKATIIRLRHAGLPTDRAFDLTTSGWTIYLGRLGVVLRGDANGPDPILAVLAALPRTSSDQRNRPA